MKIHFFLLSIFFLVSWHGVNAQIKIEGTIKSKSNDPISFCSIYFDKSHDVGTSANELGMYVLSIPDSIALSEHIIFSAIGYLSQAHKISDLLVSPNVQLEENVQMLDEVEVTGSFDLAGKVAKKAFDLFDNNFPDGIHSLNGFYREVSFTRDSSYLWLLEADLTIQDFAYRKPFDRTKIQLHQLRRSDDNRTSISMVTFIRKFIPTLVEQNNLYRTYQNPLRNYYSKDLRLGRQFIATHDFVIEAYTKDGEDSLAVIRYASIYNSKSRNYSGRLTINLTDFGILQVEELVSMYGDMYYSLTNFRKIEDRYYPTLIKEISPGKDDLENEIQMRTLVFYEIYHKRKEASRIRRNQISRKNISLDGLAYTYDEEFWTNYAVYKASTLNPKVINSLGGIGPLQAQFRRNSGK